MNSSSKNESIANTDHRILVQQPVHGPEGFSAELEATPHPGDGGTYLALHARSNDIVLYLGIQWQDGEVVFSRCIGGEWIDRMSRPSAFGSGPVRISFDLRPGAILVKVGDGGTVEWRMADFRNEVFSLHACGDWKILASGTSDADVNAPEVILPDLPAGDRLNEPPRRDLIFDFGMHNGDDTDFYLRKGFHVVAVEANPTLCALGVSRFAAEIAEGRLTICNVGVAPARGELTFYINRAITEWSSFDREIASRGHPVSEVKVLAARPEDFFKAFGVPYYCKIDIEGFDRLVVDAVAKLPVKPGYVSFENGAPRDFELLAAAGYDSFLLVEQSAIPQVSLPIPSREGIGIEHAFPSGSSGPFGLDLAGEWLGVEETRAMLEKHHHELAERAERGYDWWDLHARHRVV